MPHIEGTTTEGYSAERERSIREINQIDDQLKGTGLFLKKPPTKAEAIDLMNRRAELEDWVRQIDERIEDQKEPEQELLIGQPMRERAPTEERLV